MIRIYPAIKALSVSIPIVIINGCLVDLFIPSLLHKLQLDLKSCIWPVCIRSSRYLHSNNLLYPGIIARKIVTVTTGIAESAGKTSF